MPDSGLTSQVIRATTLPALGVEAESGTITEVNHAATATLRNSDLQSRTLFSLFPHHRTQLRQALFRAQTEGSSQVNTTDSDGTAFTLAISTLEDVRSVLLMTIHPVFTPVTTGQSEFMPIAPEPFWQLLPPRDQLHHLLAQSLTVWPIEAIGLLMCHAEKTVVIDHGGIDLPWDQVPLMLYAPLERALQRGTSPCINLQNRRLRLAPLFVETGTTAWGAIAFTITDETEHHSESPARAMAASISAILAHAHQKFAIASSNQLRHRAFAQRDHLVNHSQQGVIYLHTGDIEVINNRACEYLNWKREDVWQRPISNLLGTLGNLGTRLGSTLLANPASRTEISGRLDRRHQRGRDLDLVLEPVPEEPGSYWLLINDPALPLMAATVPDETSQTLGRLHQLNVTVHEMKTPLTGMVWQLAVLDDMIQKSSLPPESPVFTTLATVRQKVEQTLSIMDDVKNWVSTGQKPNFDFCDLKVIAEEAIVAVEQARRGRLYRPVRIRRAFESLVPLVEGDARRLHQMLTNLIKNAAEAITKDEGEVEVLLRPLRREQLLTYGLTPEKNKVLNNGVELRVRDTGLGMTKSQQLRIFDPEVSFKLGGSGIGLWVVRTVVEQHGGEILVDSEVGSGTTFTILLPQRVAGVSPDP